MAYALNVNPEKLIEKAAAQLKTDKSVSPPEWAGFVKTGMHAERPPVSPDWWYMRSAAVLRSVYKLGPIGTSKLRTKYGGRKNRGNKPEHFYKGGGAIIRTVLQQLEEAGLVKKAEAGVHKGRVMTPKGRAFLDNLSRSLVPKLEKKVKIPEVKEKAKIETPTTVEKAESKAEVKTEEKSQKSKVSENVEKSSASPSDVPKEVKVTVPATPAPAPSSAAEV